MQGVGISIGVYAGSMPSAYGRNAARTRPFRGPIDACEVCRQEALTKMASEPTKLPIKEPAPVKHYTSYMHEMPRGLWQWLDFFTGG